MFVQIIIPPPKKSEFKIKENEVLLKTFILNPLIFVFNNASQDAAPKPFPNFYTIEPKSHREISYKLSTYVEKVSIL